MDDGGSNFGNLPFYFFLYSRFGLLLRQISIQNGDSLPNRQDTGLLLRNEIQLLRNPLPSPIRYLPLLKRTFPKTSANRLLTRWFSDLRPLS